MTAIELTRERIRSGQVRALAEQLGTSMRFLSEDELAESLSHTLAEEDLSSGIWVFGYGSLIWNPAFHFDRRVIGTLSGYHRRFCLWTALGRGCPEHPGLVLGLEAGGSCTGVALHIPPDLVQDELAIIWAREMIGGAYMPKLVEIATEETRVRALAFVIDRDHDRYAGDLPEQQVAEVIATASGILGPCADYLTQTVDHLVELGIHDPPLERLRDKVEALRAA